MERPRAAVGRLLWAPPLIFAALFFVYPLVSILGRGLRPDGRLDLSAAADVLSRPGIEQVIWFTLWMAAASAILTLAVGLPAALVLARRTFRGKTAFEAGVLIPFVLPTVVVGVAFFAWAGSVWTILVAHAFLNVAVVIRIVGGTWANLDPALEESAAALGAASLERFRRVLLPLARPSIAAASTLVFLFSFTSFGVVLFLGGPGMTTIEVEIYRQTSQLLDLPVAAVLALVQLAIVSCLLTADAVMATRGAIPRRPSARTAAARPRSAAEWIGLAIPLTVVGLLVAIPLGELVARSLRGSEGLTLDHFLHLGSVRAGSVLAVSPLAAIANSLRYAAIASAIALAVGGLGAAALARSRRAATAWVVLGLPLGVSAVTIGLGYVLAFSHPPFDLRGSAMLVPLVQALVAIPFVVRIVGPALREIELGLSESAADLGASPGRVVRDVTLPLARGAIGTAAVFAFVVSLGEFGATPFVARATQPTMPIAIARLLSQPGASSAGQAAAMSVLLMLVTAAAALTIGRANAAVFGRA